MQHYKAIEERAILDLFVSLYPAFPKGRIKQTESPDFILSLGRKRTIGIELTKLYLHNIEGQASKQQNFKLEPGQIQQIIDRKGNKINLYHKKKTDELWLIIVLGFDENLKSHLISNNNFNHIYQTGFNKVFMLDMKQKNITMLLLEHE